MLSKMNLKYLYFVLSFLFCTSVFAQNDFEGKIVLKISGDQTSDINYFIKQNKIRMEMNAEGNEAIILYNLEDSKTFMIMPDQEMYMEMQGIDYKSQMESEGKSSNITRTGEFKDINGYKCERWVIKDDDSEVEAWMTNELGSFFMLTNPMNKGEQNNWQEKLQGNYFPMKVEVKEDGEIESSMEVLSVNKIALKDDLFTIPEGYQKFDMPNMNIFKQD
jgi:hypothetical protein